MKIQLVAMILATLSLQAQATIQEEMVIELGHSIAQSLLDAKLELACDSNINNRGEITLKVNQECVSTINKLRSKLEIEPTPVDLVKQVDSFMDSNSIPLTK
ncbi:hypothetical protein OH457_12405 [Vibrio sp. 2art]|uniref:hypothetical protein n=1 Tax=Vibrio TaxID=662 RepID=UPI0004DB204B|nr:MULTISPECIES: hypothetical protein [Vibrio]EJG1066070.1 hypothetical protein [Vibrio parahaemolyticus O1]MCC9652234.1 hypothetical protein [Vibrio sp. MA64]MDA0114026.1 hypothetical protein [Vibrio sp. 2art]OQT73416.1 hypothetical protein EM98_023695 [Vibrio parahaemolyticus]